MKPEKPLIEWDEEQTQAWAKWLVEHAEVRELAEKYPPNYIYRLKTTGQLVILRSYCENGEVSIVVPVVLNAWPLATKHVFGINPDDLEFFEGTMEDAERHGTEPTLWPSH